MVRAFSIYVSGGQLKLHRQQSVSTPPEGWDVFGNAYNRFVPNSGGGGENLNGGTKGIPVLTVDVQNVPSVQYPENEFITPRYDERTRQNVGSNQCAIPNPANYNYGSTYQAILTGAFGRRS
jgi:hypothetical protein